MAQTPTPLAAATMPQVAEMTGRKGRVVRAVGLGAQCRTRLVYELRAKPDSCEMDSLNSEAAGGGGEGQGSRVAQLL